MAQDYKVSKAFQSTDKDTKEPQVIQTPGGNMHKYMVQVENQPIQGWIGILKKPGNAVNVGDVLYGDVTENNWGKPQFIRSQRPDGSYGGGSSAPAPQKTVEQIKNTSDLEAKIDYLTKLVESFISSQSPKADGKDTVVEDIDDRPVDLSEIDY